MSYVNRHLIHQINQSARLIAKKANEQLEPFGLYSSQWSVLYCLRTIGPMTQKRLVLFKCGSADCDSDDQTPGGERLGSETAR